MILDSAEELKGENIEFVFCGKGDREAWVREEVRRRNLSNVVFKGFIPTTEELIQVVDSADIALGHLRDIHDIRLSAANKQMQGMARRKPVISVWTKQQEDLYQTKDNPLPPLIQIESETKALTEAIRDLVNNPEKAEQIGNIARSTVERFHGIEAVTSALKESLRKALK
jgi:glycosyltransferase involved in cell wall biosynthesis